MRTYVHFGGMAWPNHTVGVQDDLGWRLRYAQKSLTRSDLLVLASFLEAYRELIAMPSRKRNERIGQIRKAVAALDGSGQK